MGIHRLPLDSSQNNPLMWRAFPRYDVIMFKKVNMLQRDITPLWMLYYKWLLVLDALNGNMPLTGWNHAEHQFKCHCKRLEPQSIHHRIQHTIRQEHHQQAQVDFHEEFVIHESCWVSRCQERSPAVGPVAGSIHDNNDHQIQDGFQRLCHLLTGHIDGFYGDSL